MERRVERGVLIPKEQFVPSTTNGAFEVDLVEGGAFNFSLSVGSLNNPYPTRKAEVFYGSSP